MKFKSFSAHILALLGLSEWSKIEDKNSITAEEVAKLKNYGFTENSSRTLKRPSKMISRTKPKTEIRERKPRSLKQPLSFAVCWVILRPV